MRLEAVQAVVVLLVLAATSPRTAPAQELLDESLSLEVVVTSLDLPTGLAGLPSGDLLLLEKNTGRVRVVRNDTLLAQPALDVNVNAVAERGLLGVAVNGLDPPWVFLFFTEAAGMDGGTAIGNRVYRYVWNQATGTLQNPQLLLQLPVGPDIFEAIHNGGVIALGPPGVVPGVGDGALLHVIIGDLVDPAVGQLQNISTGPPPNDTSVIVRIDQNGAPAPGNPLQPFCSNSPATVCQSDASCLAGGVCRLLVNRYFAYGIRNSFGLAVDPITGVLWDTENGPATFDEINRVVPGLNSGWRRIQGPIAEDPEGQSDLFVIPGSTYRDPELSFRQTIGITSIVFPVGSSLGLVYDTRVLIGETNMSQLYSIPLNATRTGFDFTAIPLLADKVVDNPSEDDPIVVGTSFGIITDLEVGPPPERDLYILSFSQGTLYRVRGLGVVPVVPRAALFALGLLAVGVAAVAPTLRGARRR